MIEKDAGTSSPSCRNCFRLRNILPHDATDRNHYWCVIRQQNGDYESRFMGNIGEPETERKISEERCEIWRPKT